MKEHSTHENKNSLRLNTYKAWIVEALYGLLCSLLSSLLGIMYRLLLISMLLMQCMLLLCIHGLLRINPLAQIHMVRGVCSCDSCRDAMLCTGRQQSTVFSLYSSSTAALAFLDQQAVLDQQCIQTPAKSYFKSTAATDPSR